MKDEAQTAGARMFLSSQACGTVAGLPNCTSRFGSDSLRSVRTGERNMRLPWRSQMLGLGTMLAGFALLASVVPAYPPRPPGGVTQPGGAESGPARSANRHVLLALVPGG